MSTPSGSQRRVIVTGASSQIGCFLLPRLLSDGYAVTALSRYAQPTRPGLTWLRGDLSQPVDWSSAGDCPALIHLALLSLLPDRLPELARAGVGRVIAFSSTSRFTKTNSSDAGEQTLAVSLAQAEDRLAQVCDTLGIHWTLFRPTLIYGAGMDKTVRFIADFVRRYRFFPLVGKGEGLRQPVHAEDLAVASLAALERPATYGKSYQLPGGETLSYRAMVERIFQALGRRPRLLPVSKPLLRAALGGARLLPGLRHLTPEMADRMSRDLCFDARPARDEFGYAPRGFALDPMALGLAKQEWPLAARDSRP